MSFYFKLKNRTNDSYEVDQGNKQNILAMSNTFSLYKNESKF